MIKKIQKLPQMQRKIVFFLLISGGLIIIALITVALLLLSLNTGQRDQSIPLVDGVTVREFAVLPDDDAYPPAVAVAADGTVYTGSFVSGAVWAITPDGTVNEVPGTREAIGAVTGLAIAPDQTVYIVDQHDADALTFGGDVKRITPTGEISVFAIPQDERGFVLPDDVTTDAAGNIYVSDRGRGEVWRFDSSGAGSLWWTSPAPESDILPAPTGLAYDATTDTILVTDSNLDMIYRISRDGSRTDLLYAHGNREHTPGFDGITVDDAGRLYVAALAQNGLVTLTDEGTLTYLAGVFRGISDVAYADGRLYVTNFDSFSLVVSLIRPRLPFALDVIELPQ